MGRLARIGVVEALAVLVVALAIVGLGVGLGVAAARIEPSRSDRNPPPLRIFPAPPVEPDSGYVNRDRWRLEHPRR